MGDQQLDLRHYPDLEYRSHVPVIHDPDLLRLQRKWEVAIGYRIFAKMRWASSATDT